MKAAEHLLGDNSVTVTDLLASGERRTGASHRLRNGGAQTGMRTAAIVMRDPLPRTRARVPFVDRNDEVQAFAADRAYHSFAERVRLWSAQAVF
jgi:hypothetical protein